MPVLVVRGRDDVLSSADGDRLAGRAADGDYVELAGAHTFLGTSVRVVGAGPGVRRPVAVTMGARPDAVTRGPGSRCDLHAAVDCRIEVVSRGYPGTHGPRPGPPWTGTLDRVRSIGYGGYP